MDYTTDQRRRALRMVALTGAIATLTEIRAAIDELPLITVEEINAEYDELTGLLHGVYRTSDEPTRELFHTLGEHYPNNREERR